MSTLAKQIIFGTVEEVADYLTHPTVRLNEIDEYGYSPLVQTAIVNSVPKAKVILDAGGKVDFTDLTGRSALHWAADNNNLELAELLLNRGADPNSYTRAGQPVLVMPFLRDQTAMKQLLYRYGANLNFAQDFINAKLLGHRFELEGRADVIDHQGTFIEVEFEGFYLEFSLASLEKSLRDFKRHYAAKHLKHFFPLLNTVIEAVHTAGELIRYQHYLVEIKQHEKRIDSLLNLKTLLIPVAYEGHAISLIKHQDWLIRCDRGEFGAANGSVIMYKIGQPSALNKTLIKNLIYTRQGKTFIDQELIRRLQLKPIGQLPLPLQISGNCSWANVEAVVPSILFLLCLQAQRQQGVINLEESKAQSMQFYKEWLAWDRNRTLSFCINSFHHANPARKATKAAMLAAILFQQCNYLRVEDREKADKILPILLEPAYQYILKSYFKVFEPLKDNSYIKNLADFLEEWGVDAKRLAGPKGT